MSSSPDEAVAESGEALERSDLENLEQVAEAKQALLGEIRKRIYGQEELIKHLMISLLSRGHSLLMGVPGLAKTLMVQTLAEVLSLDFDRIQFTPDLMPADITGTDILEEDQATGDREFRFLRGPIFTNLLLADEINRTPPKTQAALLQAMQEYEVSAGGTTYELDLPFLVFATQNPIEQEGTYPLPEAQLDRFMFHLKVDYPGPNEEVEIVQKTTGSFEPDLEQVLDADDVIALQRLVRNVPVSEEVVSFAVGLVRRSRPDDELAPDFVDEYLEWGAGPRASQYLILGGKARAVLEGRLTVAEEDIRALAHVVLRHRLLTNFQAEAQDIDAEAVIDRLLEEV
jgi:MoxR-like ATPase